MCSLKFESIAIRFPFNTRMSVAHKWEVEQTVCGRAPSTQLRAVRIGAEASSGQGQEPGNPLSKESCPSLCQSICGYLGSTHGALCTLPGNTGIKDAETALRKLVGSREIPYEKRSKNTNSKRGLWTTKELLEKSDHF